MEKFFKQQEILLMTNTSFSKQQWCEKDSIESNNKQLTQTEQLEAACWNGLLYEMFPEIIDKSKEGKKLFLWNVRHNAACLEMELCEGPASIDPLYSIDPYTFMQVKSGN